MNKIAQHALVIGIFLCAAVGMTAPVSFYFISDVAGQGGDPWQTMWRFETKAQGALGELRRDVTGSGEARLVNLSVWPWMPVHLLFGQPLAYNLIWLLSFILSGYGMFLLVNQLLDLSRSRIVNHSLLSNAPAFLAGLYYMFLPYHAAHALGHFGAMQMQWLPFIVVTALAWIRQPTLAKVFVLSVLLIIQAWTEHHYFLWLCIALLFSLIFWRREIKQQLLEKTQNRKHKIQIVILAVLLFFGIILPYGPTIKLAFQDDSPINLGQEQLVRFSADAFSFFVPASFHSLWGKASHAFFGSSFTGNISESTQYIGISIILLLLFFHISIAKKVRTYWILLALLFAIIALGPRLHIFGTVTAIPLPYGLIDEVPGVASVRAVARAGSLVGLSVAVLLGYVLAAHLHRRGAALAVAVLILLEFLLAPFPTQSAQVSGAYTAVAALPGTALIEVPAATNYTTASRALYAAGYHQKRVLGNIALERAQDPADLADLKLLPAVRQLLYLRTTDLREGRQEFFGQDLAETLPDAMRAVDASAIVIHPDSLSPVQASAVKYFLEEKVGLAPHIFDDVLTYDITSTPLISDGVIMRRGDGWDHIGFDADRSATFAEIMDEANVVFINTAESAKQIAIQVPRAPESQASVELWINGQTLGSGNTFILPPGEITVTVRRIGEGRAIIMNPSFTAQ